MTTDVNLQPALDAFRAVLAARYGDKVKAVYLFGSRARGDHRPDSDADLAVFIDSGQRTRANLLREQFELSGEAYDIWLDTGIRIQPWVFASEALANPARDENAHLLDTILTEGRAA
jgi:uncharacterized protein